MKNSDGSVPGSNKTVTFKIGQEFQRFGSNNGVYFAPDGQAYDVSGLPYDPDTVETHRFVVIKPFEGTSGVIADQIEMPGVTGGGLQFTVPTGEFGTNGLPVAKTMSQLVREGYLREILETEDIFLGIPYQNYSSAHK